MTIYGRSEELVSRCVECDLAEPESLASLGGSAPGLVDGILSVEFYQIHALSSRGPPPPRPGVHHNHLSAPNLSNQDPKIHQKV